MLSDLNALNQLYGLEFDWIQELHTGENKSYLLKSNSDLFVLKAYRANRTQRMNISDEVEISRNLKEFGLESIEFLRSIKGNFVEEHTGTQILLTRFANGMMFFSPEKGDYFRLGQELRNLHNIPWKKPALPKLDFISTIDNHWRDLLGAKFLSDETKDKFNFYKAYVKDNFNFNGQSCVHFDLHWGNIIANQEKLLFLDWEECGIGNPLLDIGTINAHLMRKNSREELLDALIDGYGISFSVKQINLATMVKFLNLAGHIPTKLDIPQLKDPASIFERYLGYFEVLLKSLED